MLMIPNFVDHLLNCAASEIHLTKKKEVKIKTNEITSLTDFKKNTHSPFKILR